MNKKRMQIKDSQLKKNLKWNILRLLRLGNKKEEELNEKLANMYLGNWKLNKKLINHFLEQLLNDGYIKHSDKYEISEKGLKALDERDKEIGKKVNRGLSKGSCAFYSLLGNVGLSALEFIIGFLSGSIGLVADAMHTAIDIIASAITWIGIKINKEVQAALFGGIILCSIGIFIAYESITKIMTPVPIKFQIVALITIIINIIVNGFFSFYKFYVGGRTRSISLVADAYHTKTDIWSSVAVLVGLLGASFGLFSLDAIAGTVVSLFIILGGYELIKESNKVMHGEDPKLEKFSKFLESHLSVLAERGKFVSLWLFNLKEMTKQENLEHMKKGFGRRFPVKLEEKDYEAIYTNLEEENLVKLVQGKYQLTDEGVKELKRLSDLGSSYISGFQPKFLNIRKIDWFAEGL